MSWPKNESLWNSVEKIEKGAVYCNDLYKKMIDPFCQWVLSAAEVKTRKVNLEYIIGSWLLHFIHQGYDKFLRLNDYEVDQESHMPNWLPVVDNYDFMKRMSEDEDYNLYLLNLFCLGKNGKLPNVISKDLPRIQYRKIGSKFNLINFTTSLYSNHNTIFIPQEFLNHKKEVLKLYLNANRKLLPYWFDSSYVRFFTNKGDYKLSLRRNDILYNTDLDFEGLIFQLAMREIPYGYLELLNDGLLGAKNKKYPACRTIMTAGGVHFNEELKFFAALNDKVKVNSVQHGAGYGIDKINTAEFFESKIGTFFYAGKWNSQYLPIPKFNQKKFQNGGEKIIFAISEYPKFVYRVHFQPMGEMYEKYSIGPLIDFLNLSKNYLKEITLRVYPRDVYGNRTINNIEKNFEGVEFDDCSKNFSEKLDLSKLVISNHIGTTTLEALVQNKPIIIFLSPKIYSFSSHFEVLAKKLTQEKVLFYDAREAFHHFESIMKAPEDWWFSGSVQKLRNEIIENYCLASVNVFKDWCNIL